MRQGSHGKVLAFGTEHQGKIDVLLYVVRQSRYVNHILRAFLHSEEHGSFPEVVCHTFWGSDETTACLSVQLPKLAEFVSVYMAGHLLREFLSSQLNEDRKKRISLS